jgi:hypothetical protein
VVGIAYINKGDLALLVAYEHVVTLGRVNFDDCHSIAHKFLPLLLEDVVGLLSLSVIHPKLSDGVSHEQQVFTERNASGSAVVELPLLEHLLVDALERLLVTESVLVNGIAFYSFVC